MFGNVGDEEPNAKKKPAIDLSEDLIIQEILTRLPIESILRFKPVSKQWYSTLSSSEFALSHLLKSTFSHPSAPLDTLFLKCGRNYYLFSCDDDHIYGNFEENLIKLDVDSSFEEYGITLTGCCNGLICLTELSDTFIIWNPATREVQKYETDAYFKRIEYDEIFSQCRAFGYASSIDDYKYIRILSVGNEMHTVAHIFSLRKKEWTQTDVDLGLLIFFGQGLHIDGKLYWIAYVATLKGERIISFDLGLEKFDIIDEFAYNTLLGIMGGCLCMCNYGSTNKGDKLMHIFRSSSMTSMKSVIGLPKGFTLDAISQTIGFTRTGKFFVTGRDGDYDPNVWPRDTQSRMLGIVDTNTQPTQFSMLKIFDEWISIARYVPSLVSPCLI